MILNEDFFDDESVVQNIDNLDDDFETSAADMGLDVMRYRYYFSIAFAGVNKKYRANAKSYTDLMKQFQKMILPIINHSDFIDNHTDIVFSLEDHDYNRIYVYKGQQYNYRFRNINKDGIPHPDTFEQFGIKVYNDPAVWENKDNLLSLASKFSVTFSFNAGVKQSRLAVEFIRVFNAIQKICMIIDKNIHPLNISIAQNNDIKKKRFQCAERGLIDIMNRLDINSVRNYLKTLYNVMFDVTLRVSKEYIDKYLSKNAYSADVVNIVKALQVKDITTLYIDEDEKSIRITIPYGVSVKPYFNLLYTTIRKIEANNKYVSLFVEGKIAIELPIFSSTTHLNNAHNSFFSRNLGYSVNELVIYFRRYDEKFDEVDLSYLQIQDLKVKYSPISTWSYKKYIHNNSYNYRHYFPVVKLNQTYIPKKMKVYDNFAKKCPAAADMEKGRIWWC